MSFLFNNLFTQQHFEETLNDLLKGDLKTQALQAFQESVELYHTLKPHIQNNAFTSEQDTADLLINPLLKILGYVDDVRISNLSFQLQGISREIDMLFTSHPSLALQLREFKKIDGHWVKNKNPQEHYLIGEYKKWNIPLDTGRSNADNPHVQLYSYCSSTQIMRGILTNGRIWRFYDFGRFSVHKEYYEVDFVDILESQNENDFLYYFYGVFANTFVFDKQELIQEKEQAIRQTLKDDIKDFLYGTGQHAYSVIEEIGQCLYNYYQAQSTDPKSPQDLPSEQDIFYNTIIFVFRLLFMTNYESRYENILKHHASYHKYSLKYLGSEQKLNEFNGHPQANTLYIELFEIFERLDKGDVALSIPMLNGGLFRQSHAPLWQRAAIIPNQVLVRILKTVLYVVNEQSETNWEVRDYRSLSSKVLGEIYEVSLGYEYRIAQDTPIHVIQYEEAKKLKTVLVDIYDKEKLTQYKSFRQERLYEKGELYLTSLSCERKRSGSYYTPDKLAEPMVVNSLETQMQKFMVEYLQAYLDHPEPESLKMKTLLNISLIDNSCGSGHFLLLALKNGVRLLEEMLLKYQQNTNANNSHTVTPEEEENLTKILTPELYDKFESPLQIKNLLQHAFEQACFCIQEDIDKERLIIKQNIQDIISNQHQELMEILEKETTDEKCLRRLFLKRCLFGVDIHPIAIEITMMALWIETFIFATPLSFIEHHFKTGNSLIYMDTQKIEKQTENDLFFSEYLHDRLAHLRPIIQEVAQLQDLTREQVQLSKQKYYGTAEPQMIELRALYDYLTYNDFIHLMYAKDPERFIEGEPYLNKKGQLTTKYNKYQKDYETMVNRGTVFKEVMAYLIGNSSQGVSYEEYQARQNELQDSVAKMKEYILTPEWRNTYSAFQAQFSWFKPFHIEIEFPDITQGFDIVIGNPPWDKVYFSEADFFPLYDSSYRTLTHSQKAIVRERYLLTYPQVKPHYQEQKTINLYNLYLQYTLPLAKGGHGNLFRYFIVRNLDLLKKETGLMTYLTPSAIMMEDSSQQIRQYILQNYRMEYFYQFENRQKLFSDVDSRFKFAVWQIRYQQPSPTHSIRTQFLKQNPDFLGANIAPHSDDIPYSLELIPKLSPEQQRLLELKNPLELNIAQKAYTHFQGLDKEYIDFTQELNMTINRDIMQELNPPNEPPTWQHGQEGYLPLYEGKMIHQYKAQFATPQYWVQEEALKQTLRSKYLHRLRQQDLLHKQKSDEELEEEITWAYQHPKLVFRELAANTNERTVISSLIPNNSTFGNTLWAHDTSQNIPLERLLYLASVFNSLPFDFLARQIVELHVTKSLLTRLPIPQPTDQQLQEAPYRALVYNSALLHCYQNPTLFEGVRQHFKINLKQRPTNTDTLQKVLNTLKCQNDLMLAQLYQITAQEMQYILTTFPVLQKKDPFYMKLLEQQILEQLT